MTEKQKTYRINEQNPDSIEIIDQDDWPVAVMVCQKPNKPEWDFEAQKLAGLFASAPQLKAERDEAVEWLQTILNEKIRLKGENLTEIMDEIQAFLESISAPT